MEVTKSIHLILLSIACMTFSAFSFAAEKNSNIESAIRAFVANNTPLQAGESLQINIDPSDLAFQVPACSQPIDVALPANASHNQITNVQVACSGTQPWHVLVPVAVDIMTPVVSAKRVIPARQTITEADLEFINYSKNKLYDGYFSKLDEVTGNEAAHLLPAGTILSKNNITLPIIVKRNQVIDLSAQYNSVVVTMQGVAQADATLNSTIKVFNPSSKRTLDAIVTGPNKAQVIG